MRLSDARAVVVKTMNFGMVSTMYFMITIVFKMTFHFWTKNKLYYYGLRMREEYWDSMLFKKKFWNFPSKKLKHLKAFT